MIRQQYWTIRLPLNINTFKLISTCLISSLYITDPNFKTIFLSYRQSMTLIWSTSLTGDMVFRFFNCSFLYNLTKELSKLFYIHRFLNLLCYDKLKLGTFQDSSIYSISPILQQSWGCTYTNRPQFEGGAATTTSRFGLCCS